MTILVAVTAALALLASPPPASAVLDVRTIPPVIRPVAGATPLRYVRLRLDVTAYGVPGHGEIVVDRTLGRFVRSFDAGPVSEREGWDGVHAWRADATGMARIEGNVDERGVIRAWARLLAPPHDGPCDCGSRAPDVTIDPVSGHVTSVALFVGEDTQHAVFGSYARASSLTVPMSIAGSSNNGTWSARVHGVDSLRAVPADTFAPPPEPHDATLHGIASIPISGGAAAAPIVSVSVNHGAPLRFLLDTGGQNAIRSAAAQRAGLSVVGAGTVGGVGAELANVRYASVRSVQIGAAELRDQPFIVLDFDGAPFDGIIGYELFARFAARIDFANETLQLASDARAFPGGGVIVPMTFDERQPQVDGALDGIPGVVTIDTGSVSAADVSAPFARAHDLVARYHAAPMGSPIRGIGGTVRASAARAAELRLGELRIRDVPLLLTDATAGFEANPTVAVNLGDRVLRRYTLVFDYRGGTIRFDPPQHEGGVGVRLRTSRSCARSCTLFGCRT